jgi:two-component system, NarL family, response regulator NreC
MRRSLRQLLDGEGDLEVVVEAGELRGLLRQIAARTPQVLVLDLGLSDGSGLAAIDRLSQTEPAPRIIAITMLDDPAFARAAIGAGASRCVLKEMADLELPGAIRDAVR